MKQIILSGGSDLAGLIARMTTAVVLFPHGAQKLLGMFGGYGFRGTMNFFTETKQLPWLVALMIILIEFFAPVFLIAGVGVRIWSLLIIILMTGIIWTSHLDNGFFMNWFNNQKGEGYEFHLLMIGLALLLAVNGGGRYALLR